MDALLRMSPRAFEEAVAEYLRGQGFADVRRIGAAGDLGVDIRCKDAQGRLVVVQCKRYQAGAKVGSPEIQHFFGMAVHAGAARGIFVTTSDFTAPARRLAFERDLELIDGAQITPYVSALLRQRMRQAVESEPGVRLPVAFDLRWSAGEPARLRLLGQATNEGDQAVKAFVTIIVAGVTYQPSPIPGAILPGESAPFVFLLDGDDADVEHGVAVSGVEISEAEIAATQPNVVIVDEQMHEPDASHPAMWLSLTFRNDGEITVSVVQAAIVLYQGNGDVREVKIVNIRLDNPEAGVVGLEEGQAAATEIVLDGIRSLSGEYSVRLVGIAEAEHEGTPTHEESETA